MPFSLAACGGGSSNQATYSFVYSADPNTLDYIAATRTTTSDVTSNLVDGLLENDQYGNFVPSLAEDWTVSEDGLTYTYKLRKDAKWYTSEGGRIWCCNGSKTLLQGSNTRLSLNQKVSS